MKNIYTFALIFFVATLAKAQFAVDLNANWQQEIPTILGGNCVQISNVTYNAGPGTAAVYHNFPGFGDGILITTGVAAFAQGPNNTPSAGNDNGLGGNSQLNQYLPTGTFTYDATWLTFNFVASYSGTVSVDYIFASEEYPEFVNAGFNDIFGFFVQGPNIQGNQQNIAVIPGTQIPVSIDNINQYSNTAYYIDNTNGTEIQYDGYTIPLTASFYADSGVVYTLSIAIGDVGDGIFDSAVFLKTHASNTQSLTGNVTYQGAPVTAGIAELFGFNTDSTAAPLLDTQPIAGGSYTFNNVQAGAYNIRLTMDTAIYPNTYPTYYDSAFVWYDADIVTAPCLNYDLSMGLMVLPGGTGTVSGTISGVNGPLKSLGTPLANAHVLLVGAADNQVYGFELSNAQGQFVFSNVPNGDYNIVIDAPGLYMQAIRNVVVDDGHKLFTNQNYVIGTNAIAIDNSTVGITENVLSGITLFPNPTADNATLRFTLTKNTMVKAELVDVTGKRVAELYNGQMAAGKQQLQPNVKGLDNGIYFIRLMAEGASAKTLKLVKSGN